MYPSNLDPLAVGADALAASSNALRDLQRRLSKAQRPAAAIPVVSPVAMRVNDRFGAGVLTKGKKSVQPVEAIDRIASEVYPVVAPRVDFVMGSNTRLIGRDPRVLY